MANLVILFVYDMVRTIRVEFFDLPVSLIDGHHQTSHITMPKNIHDGNGSIVYYTVPDTMTVEGLLYQLLDRYHQLGYEKSVHIYRETINGYREAKLDESLFLMDTQPSMIYSFLIRLEQSELRNGEIVGITDPVKKDIRDIIQSSQSGRESVLTSGKNKKDRKRTLRSKQSKRLKIKSR